MLPASSEAVPSSKCLCDSSSAGLVVVECGVVAVASACDDDEKESLCAGARLGWHVCGLLLRTMPGTDLDVVAVERDSPLATFVGNAMLRGTTALAPGRDEVLRSSVTKRGAKCICQ